YFFFSSRRRHTRFSRDWSSDVCSSDLSQGVADDYRTLYRKSQEQIIDLQAQLEEANARIAALQNAGPNAATRQQLQELMAERDQIGRASCRERVEGPVGAEPVKTEMAR